MNLHVVMFSVAGSSALHETSTHSSESSLSKETESILMAEMPKSHDDDLGSFDSSEFEQRETTTTDTREDDTEYSYAESRSAATEKPALRSPEENNSLLRSVLEDTRKLSEAKTSRSMKSRKSAPSRLPKKIACEKGVYRDAA